MAPFPWVKVLALMAAFVSQMTADFGLSSYVGYMVASLHVVDGKDSAGYLAGLLSSAYMTGCLMSAYMWGVIGDRHGRLPVLCVSLFSTMIFSIGFGLSTTFWQAYTCRFFLGLFNGIRAIMVSVVDNVCGEEHAIVGMAAITAAWSVGVVVGPGIGGILAEPANHYPRTFSESGLFGRFPYLLPNVAVASIALFSLVMVCLFLGETTSLDNGDLRVRVDSGTEHGWISPSHRPSVTHKHTLYTLSPYTPAHAKQPSWVKWAKTTETIEKEQSLLEVPRVRVLVFLYGLYSFLHTGFDQVLPLWIISSVEKGGLDWTTAEIGQVLLVCGLSILFFEGFAVPCITKRIGLAISNRVATATLVFILFAFPTISRLNGTGGYEHAAIFMGVFAFYTCSNATFLSLTLGINYAVEDSRRGEVNGIATTVGSLAGVIGPSICSAAFTACINSDHQFPIDVHLIFMVMASGFLVVGIGGWNSIDDNMVNSDMPDTNLESVSSEE